MNLKSLSLTIVFMVAVTYSFCQGDICTSGIPIGVQGLCSSRIGSDCSAQGNYSISQGFQSLSAGNTAFSAGYKSRAVGDYSYSFGYQSQSLGKYSLSIGYQAIANNIYAIALGYNVNAGSSAVAIGYNSIAGLQSYALGFNANASIDQSIAIGRNIQTMLSNSITIGINKDDKKPLQNFIDNSIALGVNVLVPTISITGPSNQFDDKKMGKVGLNIPQPIQDFHINGNILISGQYSSLLFSDEIIPKNGFGKYGIEYDSGGLNFWKPYEEGIGTNNYILFLTDKGNVGIGSNAFDEKFYVEGNAKIAKDFYVEGAAKIAKDLTIGDNISPSSFNVNGFAVVTGKVGIGAPIIENSKYNLFVCGGIETEEVLVRLKAEWSDYVFEPNYNLRSLKELEEYIIQHKHLPDIPSATMIEENGINIGEMHSLLLKKIEELTLYTISLEKRCFELEMKINEINEK